MRALLAQLTPVPRDIGANEAALDETLEANPGVDLAVFPELFFEGYDPAHCRDVARPAEVALESSTAAAKRNGTAVVVGFAERLDAGVANSVGLIDAEGRIVDVYRKTHLSGQIERDSFRAGESYRVSELAGKSVAPLICFDIEFPEPAREATVAGAEVIVTVAANMAPYATEQRLAARARALENRRPHLYVNRSGSESGKAFVGGSCVIDIFGAVIAQTDAGDLAGAASPQTLICEIPLSDQPDPEVDFHQHMRDPLEVQRPNENPVEGARNE